MAISTIDGALAGMQAFRFFSKAVTPTLVAGKPQSLWALAGMPGAGGFNTTLNGVILSGSSSQVAGQIPFADPGAGNTYLARLQAMATIPGVLLLVDRLWHNGGFTITSTSPQAITSPTWPARDNAGTTNGDGVLLGLEISAAAGAAAPTISVSYTNQAGTASRTGANINPTANSPAAGSIFLLGLQSGDTGVRSVQSLTLNASWLSGTMNLFAYRVLATLELTANNTPNAVDLITAGFARMYNGTVPMLIFIPSTTTASNISGQVGWTQG